MKLRKPLIAAAGVTALIVGIALPAGAAEVGVGIDAETSATFTLAGGVINLTVADAATLNPGVSGVEQVTGTLGLVTVNDARGGTEGWTTTATSTQFNNDADLNGGSTSTEVTYDTGTPAGTGTRTVAGSDGSILDPSAVVTATAVSGNNTATWDPELTITMPGTTLAGEYTGTVTTSVT